MWTDGGLEEVSSSSLSHSLSALLLLFSSSSNGELEGTGEEAADLRTLTLTGLFIGVGSRETAGLATGTGEDGVFACLTLICWVFNTASACFSAAASRLAAISWFPLSLKVFTMLHTWEAEEPRTLTQFGSVGSVLLDTGCAGGEGL